MNISSFGEDEAGELYVVALGGSVSKFVPDQGVPTATATRTPTATSSPTPPSTPTTTRHQHADALGHTHQHPDGASDAGEHANVFADADANGDRNQDIDRTPTAVVNATPTDDPEPTALLREHLGR